MTSWLWIVALALIATGLVGAVLPMLPGVPMVFIGLWLGAWIDGYGRVSSLTVFLLGAFTVAAIALDFIAGAMGAKRVGASRQAISGALLGSFVGLFFGLPGLLIAPFAGAVLGELLAQRSLQQATVVGIAAWLGLLFGTIAKLALSLAMVGIFGFAYFL